MKLEKTPIVLAALALFAAAPLTVFAAPTVSFKNPLAGATISGSISQTSACEATGTNIRRVVFSVSSPSGATTALNTEYTAPWNCNLDTRKFADGSYTLKAVAYDAANVSATATRSVTIQNGTVTNAPPSVSLTAPASGATVSGTAVNCAANASDTNGIKQVQFFLDGVALSTDTTSPYACSFDSTKLTNATHTLRATATDGQGATNSAQVSFNVSNATTGGTANPVPVVTFTKPANGATVPSSGAVSCTVTATDADGIASLKWYLDGNLVNTELSSPYDTCNINNLPAGAHVIKAVATDKKGALGEAQITVNAGGSTTTNTPPVVTFTKPANGATVPTSGAVSCTVTATDTDGIKSLQWYLDGKLVNTEYSSPYDTCNINNIGAGSHVIKAVATDNKGAISEAQITVNPGSTTANTPPSVAINAPTSGATITGKTAAYSASASDPGGAVSKVDMYVVQGSTQKLVGSKTTSPYDGTIDTTQFANGAATVMAIATDNLGATSQTARSVTISNTSTSTPTDPGTGGTGTSLPSSNAKAIATFESLGMYWTPGSNPGSQGCEVRYRKKSESAWKKGLNMWYDARNSECRGSLVHLAPGTEYVVEMGLPGQAPSAGVNTRTWSENFPIAKTVNVSSGSGTLKITEGGSAGGYVLYTGPATLDAANGVDYNVQIMAPYVIVRGLTLKGARIDAIRIEEGSHDVVIEDNDISGWGRDSGKLSSDGWKIGVNRDSGVSAFCRSGPWLERVVIQRNKFHDPRYGTNSWSDGHPSGPNHVLFSQCGGNHVFRFNEMYSTTGPAHYVMDAFGGEENFSDIGFPNADTDIYGNKIQHTWDDGIEAEGANRNVRIWGNYIDSTAVAIATTVTHAGPAYIFRNVYNRSRMMSMKTLDNDERNNAFKSGTTTDYGRGRRYVLHNTLLQATQSGVTNPLGAGGGLSAGGTGALTNTVSRNNIYHIWKSWWQSINTAGGTDDDLDYDLRNGSVSATAGAETNGIVGTPVYAPGHGWQSEANGQYQLAPSSPGYGRGASLPNFNDAWTAPDMGAHQSGTPAMKFGVSATSGGFPTGSGTTSASTDSGSTSTAGGTTTTAGGGGVCSTLVCAATQ